MKTLYFDCFAGASGDMILGAMIDAGVDSERLAQELAKLNVEGFSLEFKRVVRSGLSATHALVHTAHEHKHRHLSDIKSIIDESDVLPKAKSRAIQIFTRLAEAEARVHNEQVERIHFHEVGALDAIVDVVGAAICLELLEIEQVFCSPINVGSGFVEMAHGKFPVPPPAVSELIKGVPFYSLDLNGELLTPTGAAIITTVAKSYGPIPQLITESTGYGAGTREYEKLPNVLRVMIGNAESSSIEAETLTMLETNIDDASPQLLGHFMDLAFQHGALDCYFTQVQMKKNRPGVLVSILCARAQVDALTKLLFSETTTLGVRSYVVSRRGLERKSVAVETTYGPIDVKVAYLGGDVLKAMPEFEQCRRAAATSGVSLRVVENAALREWEKQSD